MSGYSKIISIKLSDKRSHPEVTFFKFDNINLTSITELLRFKRSYEENLTRDVIAIDIPYEGV